MLHSGLRGLQPAGQSCRLQILDAAVLDTPAEFGIADFLAFRVGLGDRQHHDAAVDLLPPVHPCGIFLSDITTFGEADAVQFHRICFKPEDIAELARTLGNTQRQP